MCNFAATEHMSLSKQELRKTHPAIPRRIGLIPAFSEDTRRTPGRINSLVSTAIEKSMMEERHLLYAVAENSFVNSKRCCSLDALSKFAFRSPKACGGHKDH